MKSKRIGAFIIDVIVICLFLMLVYYIVPTKDTSDININITNMTEKVLNKNLSKIDYYIEFSKEMYKLDKLNSVFTVFNTLIIMLYFILIPIITKGYTLGLYITGLRLKGKLNIKNLFLRNLISTGLLYLIISVLLVYLTKNTIYFTTLIILGIIQLLLVIISTFMVIYRRDSKGIQDFISKTEIIKEVKK